MILNSSQAQASATSTSTSPTATSATTETQNPTPARQTPQPPSAAQLQSASASLSAQTQQALQYQAQMAAANQQQQQLYYYQTAAAAQQSAATQAALYQYQIIKSPSPNSLQDQAYMFQKQLDFNNNYNAAATATMPIQTQYLSLGPAATSSNQQITLAAPQAQLATSMIPLTTEQQIYEYMHQLLEEKEKLKELFNEPFTCLLPISAKLLDDEISRVRVNLFQLGNKESVCLPEPVGPAIQLCEKLYVPAKDHPEFNFVGRILGPRGMTAKQLEQETGCKIMVRGKGSMRDKAKEDQMKGKPNWEHLNDELHVLITVEDTKNRADLKLKRAVEEIKKLLVPAPEGEDELKKKQLMELAIINGTYRDSGKVQQKVNQILIPGNSSVNGSLRSPPNPLGQPLILSPRMTNALNQSNSLMANGAGQIIASQDPNGGGLIYTAIPALYTTDHALNHQQALLDYANGLDYSQAGAIKAQRMQPAGAATIRAHPYARVALS